MALNGGASPAQRGRSALPDPLRTKSGLWTLYPAGWGVAGRTEAVLRALPHFKPQLENPELQQRSPSPSRDRGSLQAGPEPGRVARVPTSSQFAVGWLTGNLPDSGLESCCSEEEMSPEESQMSYIRKPCSANACVVT